MIINRLFRLWSYLIKESISNEAIPIIFHVAIVKSAPYSREQYFDKNQFSVEISHQHSKKAFNSLRHFILRTAPFKLFLLFSFCDVCVCFESYFLFILRLRVHFNVIESLTWLCCCYSAKQRNNQLNLHSEIERKTANWCNMSNIVLRS